ncbi:hypothetical protein EPUS_01367 [Endocarpon pusillum Z07020]|uniref:Mid2 domain-containing protein n=1 Tax=Endocarpon pusillum (strain Z07020 / HMAS-L-300199) TaxID=1263415 RepID=U1I248_ENDPU|nr:uncharacterized protein EPUS_01367 [Endocarpon pusillum Z07020]ERF76034.1 hypothetical protein EPUS_01367 [Endocarpon pusillum Z07020]
MSFKRFASPSKPYCNIILLLSPFLSLLPAHCSAGCFTPNGTNINGFNGYEDDAIYAPCKNGTSASMCCAIGPLRGSPDNCFEDGSGLCYNKNVGPYVHFWRESCTDPTWRDPACVELFTNSTTNEDNWGDKELEQCKDGSYCEIAPDENVAKACCDAGQGLFVNIVNGQVTVDTTSSNTGPTISMASLSTVTIAATPASASGAAASTTPASIKPDESSSNNGLSTGAKIGIGVGVVGALAACALLGWRVLVRKKRRRAPADYSTSNNGPKELASNEVNIQRVEMEQPN